jgi:hypothetical protein
MPRNYEPLNPSTDVTTTKTLLHESLPLSGTIVSGTYDSPDGTSFNIKDYSHGMFQSVYDYPYLSSSANHILDISIGYSVDSAFSASSSTQNAKKRNMYDQEALVLLGVTGSGVIRKFESDLKLDGTGSMDSCVFLNFSRLLYKDQIKPGSFSLTMFSGSWPISNSDSDAGAAYPNGSKIVLSDPSGTVSGEGTLATQGGKMAVLYNDVAKDGTGYGVIFYEAGVVALTSSIWDGNPRFVSGSLATNGKQLDGVSASFTGSSISGNCDAIRARFVNVSFQNTTEINSTIYFCRVPHNKFNYSTNPTYVSASKMRVKSVASDPPISYITTVGLYSAANELLAVAKLSEPLKKTPEVDMTIRVRLDY